jgi:hypothetical protein
LEKRDVPTVLTVTTLLDGVAGSLRAEVFQAQDGDTIKFADGLSGTITLVAGQIDIAHSVDIEGPGADVVTVDGNHNSRDFSVLANHAVTIAGLTITNGSLNNGGGGGILNAGTLTVNDCIVTANFAAGEGGGIDNTGTLTVTNSMITGNTAVSGGGIANRGSLTITNCTIAGNTAAYQGSGGGGGILNDGTLFATDSVISGNTTIDAGGGIFDGGLTVSDNLTRCTIADNQAQRGGGILAASPTNITGCTITGNLGTGNSLILSGGGGIFAYAGNYSIIISASTIANNTSNARGGGIYVNEPRTQLANDTIFGNVAAYGGGVFDHQYSNSLGITSCTIAGNSSSNDGGGIGVALEGGDSKLALSNTIVAGDTAARGNDIYGPVVATSDYNFVGDGNGSSGLIDGVNGNQVGFFGAIDPMLGPLQNNGGPTPTMALSAGSTALDAGAPAQLGNPDQRGIVRSGGVNIGAYQASASLFMVSAPATVQSGVPFDVTVTAVDSLGQIAVGYLGTVMFSTSDSDPGVVLPANYTFTVNDGGSHLFTDSGLGETTLITPGDQNLTATDTADSTITGSAIVTVTSGNAPSPGRSLPSQSATPGTADAQSRDRCEPPAQQVLALDRLFTFFNRAAAELALTERIPLARVGADSWVLDPWWDNAPMML